MKNSRQQGFTLAELLIALAILGVIATFTIPKILDSSSDQKWASTAKEAASIIGGAYSTYKLSVTPVTATTMGDLTPYMNYVKSDTDDTHSSPVSGTALQTCSAALVCLYLHNGGILQYETVITFGGTGSTNALYANFDPDGTRAGAGRVTFVQFYGGRLTTAPNAGTQDTNWTNGGTDTLTVQTTDPTWLTNWN